ncbi:MAG: hypothetical protein K0S47_405 [Herbinix sp.]|jgi:surface polysaccharide O-acyltransferase-like enzyme|nr:hypothetical protein [Herbinix sp.]
MVTNVETQFQERNFIYIAKGVALISIVAAHVALINDTYNNIEFTISYLLHSIGAVGVGVFFLLSGYLYYSTKKTFLKFIKGKVTSLLIPWIFCGTLLFFYVALRKGGLTLSQWFTTLTVYSHLYYLSILTIFYLVFWKLRKHTSLLLVLMFLSVLSIYYTGLDQISLYPYINPFNWAVYFILGFLIRQKNSLHYIVSYCRERLFLFTYLYGAIFLYYLNHGIYITYWKYAAFPVEILAMAVVFGTASAIVESPHREMFVYLGQVSFPVYLLHTPFAGIITNICNRYDLWLITLFRPVLVIISTIAVINLIRHNSKRFKLNKIIDILIGLRN